MMNRGGFHYRFAQREDMVACANVLNDWIDDTAWLPRMHSPTDVSKHFATEIFDKRSVLLVEKGTQMVGFSVMLDMTEITALYVRDTYRSKGIGSVLIDTAKSVIKDKLDIWTHSLNIRARKFYRQQGFAELQTEIASSDEGLDETLYRWIPAAGGVQ